MLHVTTGLNTLRATLNERLSVASSILVMKLTLADAKTNFKNFRVNNLTQPNDRVNTFAMTVVATEAEEDFPLGKVFLNPGDYLYQMFDEFGNLLESGMLRFNGSPNQTEYTDNTVTEKVYNGN